MRTMTVYAVGQERDREAGGIFLGSYRGVHIEIDSATEPLPKDRRERYLFDRRDPGHQAAAQYAWEKSAQTTTYVGEWHTHPEDRPAPSSRDIRTWEGLIAKAKDPLLFIILGWSCNWYGVGHEGRIYAAEPI